MKQPVNAWLQKEFDTLRIYILCHDIGGTLNRYKISIPFLELTNLYLLLTQFVHLLMLSHL